MSSEDSFDPKAAVADLGAAIDNVEKALAPFLATPTAYAQLSNDMPVLDKAKFNVLSAYTICSLIFSSLRLAGVEAKKHDVFGELGRVKGYFDKIKSVESGPDGVSAAAAKGKAGSSGLNTDVAVRLIKGGLAGNDRFDRDRAAALTAQRERAREKLDRLDLSAQPRPEVVEEEQEKQEEESPTSETGTERKKNKKKKSKKAESTTTAATGKRKRVAEAVSSDPEELGPSSDIGTPVEAKTPASCEYCSCCFLLLLVPSSVCLVILIAFSFLLYSYRFSSIGRAADEEGEGVVVVVEVGGREEGEEGDGKEEQDRGDGDEEEEEEEQDRVGPRIVAVSFPYALPAPPPSGVSFHAARPKMTPLLRPLVAF